MRKIIFLVLLALLPLALNAQTAQTYVTAGDTVDVLTDSSWMFVDKVGDTDSTHLIRPKSLFDAKANVAAPTITTSLTMGSAALNEAELEIIDGGTLSTEELNFSDGVTSNIQIQLDSKLAEADTVDFTTILEDYQLKEYTAINVESGGTYTFVIEDDDEYTTFTSGSAVTVTIPANSAVAFPVGATIDCEQEGAGAVTFQTADGVVTLEAFGSDTVSAGVGAVFTLIKKSTNVWRLTGNL